MWEASDTSILAPCQVIVVFDADMKPKKNFFCKARAPGAGWRGDSLPLPVGTGGTMHVVVPCTRGHACCTLQGLTLTLLERDTRTHTHPPPQILEVMTDDSVALCLSPQAFSNVNKPVDIYNNSNAQVGQPGRNVRTWPTGRGSHSATNTRAACCMAFELPPDPQPCRPQFWEYILPGCDAWGYIACTGTNFCLRARALGCVGWFPEYCITEDYALSMELRAAGFKVGGAGSGV